MIDRANGRTTVPQIFIGATHVGGCDDLHALEAAGRLDPLLAARASNGMTGHRADVRRSASASIAMRSGPRSGQTTPRRATKLIEEAQPAAAPTMC